MTATSQVDNEVLYKFSRGVGPTVNRIARAIDPRLTVLVEHPSQEQLKRRDDPQLPFVVTVLFSPNTPTTLEDFTFLVSESEY